MFMTQKDEIPLIPAGTTLEHLDNGLTVIVAEDHSAPVVSAQAWCRAGSIHEGRWIGAGLSHVLEHMLFKGTTTRPASRIDQEVQEAGGYMNAYTSFDRTVYHIDVPNTGTRVALDILADITQNASLPPDELSSELDVIRREMDMGEDDPGRRSSRRLFETAYTRSLYRFPIIGLPDIFNQLQPADIHEYYRTHYVPNNLFFVVVGDVDSQAVVAQIRESYASAKAGPPPCAVLPNEPRQTAPREVIEETAIELGHIHIAWHIPELTHPDLPALDVLAGVLGGGRSSRLYRQVRDGLGLAHSIDAWTYSPGNPGLFGMSLLVDGDKAGPAREAALSELEKICSTAAEPEEIQKAIKQFKSVTLAMQKTMQGHASDLGSSWLATSDLSFSQRYLAAIEEVTAGDLLRVANEYLAPSNRTTYGLLPRGTIERADSQVLTTAHDAIQRFELRNGLRLLIKEDRRLPFVEIRSVFLGGVLTESIQTSGTTHLMARSMIKGTTHRDGETLMREIESVGGHLDTYAGNNTFGANTEVLADDLELGLEVIADVLLHPSFPEEAVRREQLIQLAAIRDQKDHLLRTALKGMRRILYGSAAYGLDALGEEGVVANLTPTDLARHHGFCANPGSGVIAVFGHVQPERVRELLEGNFTGWQGTKDGPSLDSLRQVTALGSSGGELPDRNNQTLDKKQSVLAAGFHGTTFESPDRHALDLLQEACSDLGSRLFMRIREELGLAYYVGAQHMPGLIPGYFAFYCGTAPEHVAQVEEELRKEIRLLRDEGLSAEELNRARAKLVGHRKISRQDLGAFATNVALDDLYGLGHLHYLEEDALYESVTLEAIQEVANRYLKEDTMAVSVVGGTDGP